MKYKQLLAGLLIIALLVPSPAVIASIAFDGQTITSGQNTTLNVHGDFSAGTTTIQSGGTLTINATGGITLNPGFSVDLGGRITANPSAVLPHGAPTATAQSVRAVINTALPITLAGTDPEGQPLTYAIVTQPQHGVITGTPPNIIYTPNQDYEASDSLTFTVSDGPLLDGGITSLAATVSIEVNSAPIANHRTITLNKDDSITFNLSTVTAPGPDSDPEGDTFTYSQIKTPTKGTFVGTYPEFTFTPNVNYNCTDTFKYKLIDSYGVESQTAIVTFQIIAENSQPVANTPAAVTTKEDTAVDVTLTGQDVDPGDTLTFHSKGSENGSITINAQTGVATFLPESNYDGDEASFTFLVKDSHKQDSEPITVPVAITSVNDRPTAFNKSVNVNEDDTDGVSIVFLAYTESQTNFFASDLESDPLTFSVVDAPKQGKLIGQMPNLIYTPNTNYSGSDTFTFRAADQHLQSEVRTVTVNVIPVNDAPSAAAISAKTKVNTPVTLQLKGSDIEDDTSKLTFLYVENSSNHGNPQFAADNLGKVTFLPEADYIGNATFQFHVKDSEGKLSETAGTVTVTIEGSNQLPIAQDLNHYVADAPTDITFSATDDGGPQALTYRIVTQPTQGTLNQNGAVITYTPNADAAGFDEFTYVAHDGAGDSAPATVTLYNFLPQEDLILENITVTTAQTFNGAGNIIAQNSFAINAPDGNATLKAAGRVTLGPGFSMQPGAQLNILTGQDVLPPGAPLGVTASNITLNSVDLQWQAAPDNSGEVSYRIYQDNELIQTTAATTFSVTNLFAAKTYTFEVETVDVGGIASLRSKPLKVTTTFEAIFVDSTGSDANDGTSDQSPVKSIQLAIDNAANGALILVRGIHTLSAPLDTKGKAVRLKGIDGAGATTLKGTSGIRLFHIHQGETKDTLIEGFTLIATGEVTGDGGIALIENASPIFRDCIIQDGRATNGAGVAITGVSSTPLFERCELNNNAATSNGGAIYFANGAKPIIRQCKIKFNTAQAKGAAIFAGQ